MQKIFPSVALTNIRRLSADGINKKKSGTICCLVFGLLACTFLSRNLWIVPIRSRWPIESYFAPSLDATDGDLLDQTFRAFYGAINGQRQEGGIVLGTKRFNLTYFIFSGTLLGSYRHHGRIPWDDDIDIIFNTTDKKLVHDILLTLEPDYILETHTTRQWKLFPRAGRFILHRNFRTPYLDIFFFQENSTHIWNESPDFLDECWPKTSVFPLIRRPFGKYMLPAPCDTHSVLSRQFDLEVCQARSFSHLLDLPMFFRPLSVRCVDLAHLIPLVHRPDIRRRQELEDEFCIETLMFADTFIANVTLRSRCTDFNVGLGFNNE